nr:hypothetical protein [uncultured Methanoregula sp.]
MINAADPREIFVIGFIETTLDTFMKGLEIDIRERLGHSLDEIVEPAIGRQFGILVARDDFSAEGDIGYKSPAINGEETDLEVVSSNLSVIAAMVAEASKTRDLARAAAS